MLTTGLKAGMLPDFRILNRFAKTAEQIANVNIIAHIKALSDNAKSDTSNIIYYTQLRDRLMLISIYVSASALVAPLYPVLTQVKDENNNTLTPDFTFISNQSETFIVDIDDIDYTITFLKTSYSVAPASIGKRIQATFNPINTAKDFDATYFNSMVLIQVDSSQVSIDTLVDEGLSDFTWINDVKEAFRKNFSYSLGIFDLTANKIESDNILDFITLYNDLYEVGALSGEKPIVSKDGASQHNYFLQGLITSGTLFDYRIIDQSRLNFNKIPIGYTGISIKNGLYLTTTDTFSLAINSISQDALNSYDLIQIKKDFSNRLQGKLYYPVVGNSLITEGNPEVPVNLDFIFNNNIDAISFNYSIQLISGYELRFAIK